MMQLRIYATLRFVVLFTLCNLASRMLRELLHVTLFDLSKCESVCMSVQACVRACVYIRACAHVRVCVTVHIVELFYVSVNASISVKYEYVDSDIHY